MKTISIVLFIVYSILTSSNLISSELKRFPIHPEVDTSQVKFVFDRGEFIDIYTKISGLRFDKNLKLVNKFLQVDTLAKQKSFIHSVNYLNDKVFVGTFSSGLIVLDTNLNITNQYLSDNSELLYSKSCGTIYDPIVKKYFSINCAFGLFVQDEQGNEEYLWEGKPFESAFIGSFNLIDDLYYSGLERFDFDKKEFYYTIEVFDRSFNLVKTYDLIDKYGFSTNYIRVFKDFGQEIGFVNGRGEFVLVDKKSEDYRIVRKADDDKDLNWINNTKLIDEKIYFFGSNGLYNFDMQTEEVNTIPFSNEIDIQENKIIYDIERIEESYFVASNRGLLIIDNKTNIETDTLLNEANIKNGILTVPTNNFLMRIFNNVGQIIYESNSENRVDLNYIISFSGVYYINLISEKDTKTFVYPITK